MKSKQILSLLLFSLIVYIIGTGCTDFDDDFITDNSCRLSFSKDTLSFDTIFSGFSTPTESLVIRNPYDKPVKINGIYLANAKSSGFRINVDGNIGTSFSNIELMAKDSMYIFVEATMKSTNSPNPLWVEDSICFKINNNYQRIILQAAAQDVIVLKGKNISQQEKLNSNFPYLIYDSIIVEENGKLILAEGTRLFFRNNAYMKVKGTLESEGSQLNPVLLRGHRLDNLFSDVPYDLVPGQWEGIYFTETSYNNSLKYTTIRNVNHGLHCEASTPDQLKIKLENCIVHNATSDLIKAINCHIEAENCQFSNAGGAVLYLIGGNIILKHCTIANYYKWGQRSNASLVLGNYDISIEDGKEIYYPLQNAEFHNSIFYGTYSTEVSLRKNEGQLFNHLFNYCMIKANGTDDENFVETIWAKNDQNENQDPQFKATGIDDYIYDFHIDSLSAAKNNADISIAVELPFDIDGNSRFSDNGPDRGAYEWIPTTNTQ